MVNCGLKYFDHSLKDIDNVENICGQFSMRVKGNRVERTFR